jgi:hypothetical protein
MSFYSKSSFYGKLSPEGKQTAKFAAQVAGCLFVGMLVFRFFDVHLIHPEKHEAYLAALAQQAQAQAQAQAEQAQIKRGEDIINKAMQPRIDEIWDEMQHDTPEEKARTQAIANAIKRQILHQ